MKMKQLFENRSILGVLTAVILLITLVSAKSAFAMPPLAVSLISFTVTSQENAVLLKWETATELNAVGFTVERKPVNTGDTEFQDITGFINAEGDAAIGAKYSYLDETAVNGQTYVYRLVEYEAGNVGKNELERVQITIGAQQQATATSVTTIGGAETATPRSTTPPTATIRPSSTPRTTTASTATPTARAIATVGSVATATRSTSVTATRNTSATATPTTRATATTRPTTASSSSSGSTFATVAPTVATQNDTQESVTDTGGAVAAAQGITPTAASFDEMNTDSQPSVVGGDSDYPTNDTGTSETALLVETATPYPISEAVGPNNNNGGNTAVNVIGSNVTDGDSINAGESEGGSGNMYLWFGFIIALLIFIAGVIGTAVLLVRKNDNE